VAKNAGVLCSRCRAAHWRVSGVTEPILEVICPACKNVEWIGFTAAEWAQYVVPLTAPARQQGDT